MSKTSTSILKRRIEWDRNVDKYPDPCGMVGRPISGNEFSYLVKDIAEKLHISSMRNNGRFLDVGCGNSFLLSMVQQAHHAKKIFPFGIDFSMAMIKNSRKNDPPIGLVMGETKDLPFDDDTFDRVLCYSVLHYFPNEEYAVKTIHEIVRVCRRGGYFMIGDIPDSKSMKMLTKRELNLYSRQDRPGIHRIDEWLFYDLEMLSEIIEDSKCTPQILSQPKEIKTSHYRFDIVAKKNE
jgi:ubiquinone/menaquinone biosynthesis C-methylase UbiE